MCQHCPNYKCPPVLWYPFRWSNSSTMRVRPQPRECRRNQKNRRRAKLERCIPLSIEMTRGSNLFKSKKCYAGQSEYIQSLLPALLLCNVYMWLVIDRGCCDHVGSHRDGSSEPPVNRTKVDKTKPTKIHSNVMRVFYL